MERQKSFRFHLIAETVQRFLQHLFAPLVQKHVIGFGRHGCFRDLIGEDFTRALLFLPQTVKDTGTEDLIEIRAEPGAFRIIFHDQIMLEKFEHDILEQVLAFIGCQSVTTASLKDDGRIPVIEFLPGDFIAGLDFSNMVLWVDGNALILVLPVFMPIYTPSV